MAELDNADDVLARFLFQKRHFNRTENRATPEAFMPPLDLQLSVYLVTDTSADATWDLGKHVLAEHPRPRLYGRLTSTSALFTHRSSKHFETMIHRDT